MKTVKARIAVAVDPYGQYDSAGWKHNEGLSPSDETMMYQAVSGFRKGEARYWLEADLPIPETKVVQATVIPELTSDN